MSGSQVAANSNDMSRYKPPPEKRVPATFRYPVSVLRKLDIIRELWRAKAVADGEPDEAVEAIDNPFVVTVLLSDAEDAELAEFGGLPADDDALAEMVERIKSKKPLKK